MVKNNDKTENHLELIVYYCNHALDLLLSTIEQVCTLLRHALLLCIQIQLFAVIASDSIVFGVLVLAFGDE